MYKMHRRIESNLILAVFLKIMLNNAISDFSLHQERLGDLSFKKHSFNSFLSDNLPLNRAIPDVRAVG